nr:hypothetical protein [Pedobacter panaciterrae]
MKKFALSLISYVLISCNVKPVQTEAEKNAQLDSFSMEKYGKTSEERIKDMTNEVIDKAFFDTSGLSKSPVKVTRAILFKKEYSSYRDIRLTYKNISRKPVAGIKFRWRGINAFGDPADMGGTQEGYGGGFTDDVLKPGKTETGEWSILSRDGKKVVLAWPIEIAFTDGSKWELK